MFRVATLEHDTARLAYAWTAMPRHSKTMNGTLIVKRPRLVLVPDAVLARWGRDLPDERVRVYAITHPGILIRHEAKMDKEHVKGAAEKVVGKTKEVVGHAVGSKKLEAEGKADEVKGAAHEAAGDAKDAGKEAINAVKNASRKH